MKKGKYKFLAIGFAIMFLISIGTFTAFTNSAEGTEAKKFSMTWYDVGAGDCSAIYFPNGKVAVIDGGTSSQGSRVVTKLRNKGIKTIDYLINSHPDSDHCGGLVAMFNNFEVKNFYYPNDVKYDTKTAKAVMRAARNEAGCNMISPYRGYAIKSGDVQIQFVQPDTDYSTDNQDSLAEFIEYGSLQILTCGDIEKGAGNYMTKHNVDILQLPHHGSKYATSTSLIKRFDPERVVVSTDGKKYGHPNKEVFQRLKAYDKNIKVFRTDKKGDITVTATKSSWKFTVKGVLVSKYASSTVKPSTGKKPGAGNSTTTSSYVYITDTGKKYHKGSCSYLSKSKHKISLKTAKARGYTPCSRCFK